MWIMNQIMRLFKNCTTNERNITKQSKEKQKFWKTIQSYLLNESNLDEQTLMLTIDSIVSIS